MQYLGLPELTNDQIKRLCTIAEETARTYIQAKVPKRKIETLNIGAEASSDGPLNLVIDVDVTLAPTSKESEARKMADEAIKEAFKSAEQYLRDLACHSRK